MRKGIWAALACVTIAIALPVGAGCGGDDDDDEATATEQVATGEADALQEEIAELGDEQQIERVGAAWADSFAARDEEMCGYLHPDLAPTPETCLQYLEGGLTLSVNLQSSFAGATVTDVKLRGDSATATFSNRQRVNFEKDPDGAWRISGLQ
jgi:ketosteroid isomerase-like protein